LAQNHQFYGLLQSMARCILVSISLVKRGTTYSPRAIPEPAIEVAADLVGIIIGLGLAQLIAKKLPRLRAKFEPLASQSVLRCSPKSPGTGWGSPSLSVT
jgi:hypothetical protein